MLGFRAVKVTLEKVDPNFQIRSKQLEAISSIISGQDTVAILPTSYGKSLIFCLIPSVCRQLRGHTDFAIIVVLVPLESIIKDQIKSANELSNSLGFNACRVELVTLEKIVK